MALPVTALDWRKFDVTAARAGMDGVVDRNVPVLLSEREAVTYLYPKAILEGRRPGCAGGEERRHPKWNRCPRIPRRVEKAPRGDPPDSHRAPNPHMAAGLHRSRSADQGVGGPDPNVDQLVQRGVTNIHLDILGPTDHAPDYYMLCREKARRLGWRTT